MSSCAIVVAVARHLGDVLRELRLERGLSKNALARRADLSVSVISRIESHFQHTMSRGNLARIAQALHVRVEDVEAMTGRNDEAARNEYPLEEWLRRDGQLTDRQIAAVVAVYEGYTKR